MIHPMLLCDFYKTGHIDQYPADTKFIYVNWTSRSSRVEGQNWTVHFGLQHFIKKYMVAYFNDNFFSRPLDRILKEYARVIKRKLGVTNPRTDHIEALWRLGYLPLKIYSLLEGTHVPIGCPSLVMVNTDERFFWLPNFFETLLSLELWKPSCSATIASIYRRIGENWATKFGHTDLGFVDWQFHDFSMRGMSGLEDAFLSGMGHLLFFDGTDTIGAILTAEQYYSAEDNVGGSIPATEHSVMCAGSKDGEFKTFKRLITKVYPEGNVAIVSDTWDLWQVLEEFIPRLKDVILSRKGKLVIRPDSGDPVKIMLGDPDAVRDSARFGVVRMLANTLGVNAEGLINNAAAIYGDSITPARANAILGGLVEFGLSPYNAVFGVGSYTYEYQTRDTFGCAMKATAGVFGDGPVVELWKDPITDNGGKRSHRGIPVPFYTVDGKLEYLQTTDVTKLDDPKMAFKMVFANGDLLLEQTFAAIRKRARA